MVGVKRALAINPKEEKMACFYEMKMMEEEKWKAKPTTDDRGEKGVSGRKRFELEVQRLALETEEKNLGLTKPCIGG